MLSQLSGSSRLLQIARQPRVGDDLELLPADQSCSGAVDQVGEAVSFEELLHPGGRESEDLGGLGGGEPVGLVVVGVGVPGVGVHGEVLDLADGCFYLVGAGAGEIVFLEYAACLIGWRPRMCAASRIVSGSMVSERRPTAQAGVVVVFVGQDRVRCLTSVG